jgi:lysozyme
MPDTIDVFQKYQGSVNWTQVHAAGVRRVFVKLTNGAATAAPAGDGYVNGAHSAGLTVGGYAYALGGDPSAQAEAFAHELLRMPNALGLAPALDFEDSSLLAGATQRRNWIAAFFGRLKALVPRLTRVLLYSSGSTLTAINASTITVPGLAVLIWDAEYGPNNGGEHPVTHYTGAVAVHQFTSVGHVAGIEPAVDEDTVTADITAIQEVLDVLITDPVPANPAPGTVGAALASVLFGQAGIRRAGAVALAVSAIQTQVAAMTGALPQQYAQVLAAIHTIPVAKVDAAALEAAGLPAEIAAALLAAISAAADGAALPSAQ